MSSNVANKSCIVLPMNYGQLSPVWYRDHKLVNSLECLRHSLLSQGRIMSVEDPLGRPVWSECLCNCTMCTCSWDMAM